MRIIIAGSRGVSKTDVDSALEGCPWVNFSSVVVSGTAKGVDQYGEFWAKRNEIEVERYPAAWKKYGKKAGPVRNEVMARNAEGLIAIWDGKSRGTASMIDLAKDYGLRITVYNTKTYSAESYPPSGALEAFWEEAEERAGINEYGGGMDRKKAELEAGKMIMAKIRVAPR